MLVAVKMPHIEIKGDVPEKFLEMTRDFFGSDSVTVVADDPDDEIVRPETSKLYQGIEASITPGKAMRHYREIHNMTQEQLGKRLGGVARQEVSKMETGSREISKKTAKKLAKIFEVPVGRFI